MADGLNASNDSGPSGDVNELTKAKQKKMAIVGVGALFIGAFLLVNITSSDDVNPNDITSNDLTKTVTRTPGDKDSFAVISGQVNGLLGDMEKFKATTQNMNNFLETQDASILQDIQSTVNGTASQMEDLEERLKKLETQGLSSGARGTFGQSPDGAPRVSDSRAGSGSIPARPTNADELFGPRGRQDGVGTQSGGLPRPAAVPKTRKQSVIDLFPVSEGESATETKEASLRGEQVNAKKPEVFDTKNYVPPNAYVTARLVVSVDAAIGQSQAADPKAAQFIITGAAHHVQIGNKIESTDLEGCLVNGSAQGNLSSERVFINLHVMTCPLGNGRSSISQVEGYATHLGKNGIRGTVVSREGDLVTKSIIAGTLGGLGRTAQQFGTASGFGSVGGGLISETPSTSDIVTSSLGSGVGAGADVYSQYLLERARAYEPVVSLPTGIEVELVFISGTLVRPLEE